VNPQFCVGFVLHTLEFSIECLVDAYLSLYPLVIVLSVICFTASGFTFLIFKLLLEAAYSTKIYNQYRYNNPMKHQIKRI
jgi:hypothetical protein